MAFTSWRGVVGCIKPTMRPGGIEELIRILPDGVCLLPLFLDIRKGDVDEFKRAVAPYEPLVARLAEARVDVIHPEGAPPFMLLGHAGEEKVIRTWEDRHGVPVFTSGSNHVRALRALGHPDAFPAEDLMLQRAFPQEAPRLSAKALIARAEAWRPWRAYAVMLLWRDLMPAPRATKSGGKSK